jgi:hypothetical protein
MPRSSSTTAISNASVTGGPDPWEYMTETVATPTLPPLTVESASPGPAMLTTAGSLLDHVQAPGSGPPLP